MKRVTTVLGAALAGLAMSASCLLSPAIAQAPDIFAPAQPSSPPPAPAAAAPAPAAASPTAAPNAEAHTRGMSLAPTYIVETKVPCTLTDAAFRFSARIPSASGAPVATEFVEVACADDLGYMLARRADNTYFANDCLMTGNEAFAGPALTFKCVLPANAKPTDGLKAHMEAAGTPCVITNAVPMGSNESASLYEVACENADGQILILANPRNARPAEAVACYSALDTPQACKLTTKAQTLAPIMALAGKAATPCEATSQRFVTRTPQGARYYEFKCPNATGFMVEATQTNTFVRSIPCAEATRIAGGCKL